MAINPHPRTEELHSNNAISITISITIIVSDHQWRLIICPLTTRLRRNVRVKDHITARGQDHYKN